MLESINGVNVHLSFCEITIDNKNMNRLEENQCISVLHLSTNRHTNDKSIALFYIINIFITEGKKKTVINVFDVTRLYEQQQK